MDKKINNNIFSFILACVKLFLENSCLVYIGHVFFFTGFIHHINSILLFSGTFYSLILIVSVFPGQIFLVPLQVTHDVSEKNCRIVYTKLTKSNEQRCFSFLFICMNIYINTNMHFLHKISKAVNIHSLRIFLSSAVYFRV